VYHHHGRKPGKPVRVLKRIYAHARGAYYAKFILNRQTRTLWAKHWWWGMRWQPKGQVLMEVFGAIHYCLRRCFLYQGVSGC